VKDIIEDYTDVFESNICDPDASWEKCFNNFCDIIALLRSNRYDEKRISKFLIWASQLLQMKKTITTPVGTSFVNWRKDYSRKNIWKE
tara:strand:- start:726 stop:989 length:264 start_codon:yes stop_codon:yes gene_type:complete